MNLQTLKIPRGSRGDWPALEYALIDRVQDVITEVELARGSNSSLAAELEETYATKSYVQLAIGNPTPGDIFVSDLSVKLSESGLVGYSLQVNGAGNLQFLNTYSLSNGTLSNPSVYFNDGVDAGIYVNYDDDYEDFNIKVFSGIIAKFSHNKISGENNFIFGNIDISSGGVINGISDILDIRKVTANGTGVYKSEFAEVFIATISTNTIQTNNFGKILDLGVVDLNLLPSDTIYGKCAAGSTNSPEANSGYISQLVLGSGELAQEFHSTVTGYFYRRIKVGGVLGSWQKYAKAGGDTSLTFSVANGSASNDAVSKLQLDTSASSTLSSANSYTDSEIIKLADAVQDALDTKAALGGSSSQPFLVASATLGSEAVPLSQMTAAIISATVTNQAIVNLVYPVSSIIEFDSIADPNTLWPWTTWAVYGSGKFTVCIDGTDAGFDTLAETGGAKGHKMTLANLIEHDHDGGKIGAPTGVAWSNISSDRYPDEGKTSKTGSSDPDPIPTLPPYIVIKRWVRTA